MTTIIVTHKAVDGGYDRRTFKTLEGARKFAWHWVGENAEVSWSYGYAISDDGIGKVTVKGDATVFDLFPRAKRELLGEDPLTGTALEDDLNPAERPEIDFPGEREARASARSPAATEDRGPVECEGGCGHKTTSTEGICYECQCRGHAEGWFDMDGGGWR